MPIQAGNEARIECPCSKFPVLVGDIFATRVCNPPNIWGNINEDSCVSDIRRNICVVSSAFFLFRVYIMSHSYCCYRMGKTLLQPSLMVYQILII